MFTNMETPLQAGGGKAVVKQVIHKASTAGASTWTTIDNITESGLACVVIDNYNNMQWQNETKGTSGTFTDDSSQSCGYASFDVSAGDIVKILPYSGISRNIYIQIVEVE